MAKSKFQIKFEKNPRFKETKFSKSISSEMIKEETEKFLAKGGKIIGLPEHPDSRYDEEVEKFDHYYQSRILGRNHRIDG